VTVQKSSLHANIGLLLILLIGFGFGALLLMQSKSAAIPSTLPSHSSSAVESMPGMDMTANEMKVTRQNNSSITLLSIFLGINSALIVTAIILKRVRSKQKVLLHVAPQELKFEGGTK
jgi:hypothetical protein